MAVRRRRHLAPGLAAAVLVSGLAACGPGSPHTGRAPTTTAVTAGRGGHSTTVPANGTATVNVSAAIAPWRLEWPVSRPVVLPDGGGFAVLGGLATGDISTDRIATVDLAAGTETDAGRLALAVHDSAGAVLGGRYLVFAGGSATTVGRVQAWSGSPGSEASVAGELPSPRSDLSAAAMGGTVYIAGGFDGTTMDPAVLATTDGAAFRTVARLAVPVRYAAMAAAGGSLWLFGGVTGTAEGSTEETDAIQRVDLSTGTAAVVGHLPITMGHAAAVVLDDRIFVVGGRSGGTPLPAILGFDPSTGRTYDAGTLPEGQSDSGAVVVGSTAYLVGGEVGGPTAPLDTVVTLTASG